MAQLVIQPAGNEGGRDHYRDTVETPVSMERIRPLVDVLTRKQLESLFPNGSVAVWGVTPGANGANVNRWQRIREGDVAIFLKDGQAHAAGEIALKSQSPQLAKELWRTNDRGETWEYVYFLKGVRPVEVSYGELNGLLGYEPANRFQGFNVVSPERSAPVLARLGMADVSPATAAKRYWWVNQGASYRQESAGGFVWAPKVSKSGVALTHHTNVSRLRPGDVLLHYADGIRAIREVGEKPVEAKRPSDLPTDKWGDEGHFARATYRTLPRTIPLTEIPFQWRTKEAETAAGPFTRDASVKLGYLFPLTDEFAARLLERFPELRGDQMIEAPDRVDELVSRATEDLTRAGLQFDRDLVARFAAALVAKPFVILTGLSGSGKTKLAQGFSYWLGCSSESGRCSVVPVGPDWTSKDSALGFPNALDPTAYTRTTALDLILEAIQNPDRAHFLILDEMNLSHVERYFADILSAMESGERIQLHAGPEERQGVPPDISWPKNVFVVGTVNVDETTYMFSPKVLDRAHVLEFRASRDQLATVIEEARRPDLGLLTALGSKFEAEFVSRRLDDLPEVDQKRLRAEVTLLFDVLARENYEFGYRTAVEITEFARAHRRLVGRSWRFEDAIDSEILQKVLPRIHGSQRQIEGVLRALAEVTFEPRQWSPEGDLTNADLIRDRASEAATLTGREWDPLTAARYQAPATYPRSFDKIKRMVRQLDRNGFTSFAET